MSANDVRTKTPGTVSLADEEAVKQVLVGTVMGHWDIVNNLTRLRPSRNERDRVTIFGSARAHLLASQPPLASAEDVTIPRCVNTADEAIALIVEDLARWRREAAAGGV
jgi:hypothetical protein